MSSERSVIETTVNSVGRGRAEGVTIQKSMNKPESTVANYS